MTCVLLEVHNYSRLYLQSVLTVCMFVLGQTVPDEMLCGLRDLGLVGCCCLSSTCKTFVCDFAFVYNGASFLGEMKL